MRNSQERSSEKARAVPCPDWPEATREGLVLTGVKASRLPSKSRRRKGGMVGPDCRRCLPATIQERGSGWRRASVRRAMDWDGKRPVRRTARGGGGGRGREAAQLCSGSRVKQRRWCGCVRDRSGIPAGAFQPAGIGAESPTPAQPGIRPKSFSGPPLDRITPHPTRWPRFARLCANSTGIGNNLNQFGRKLLPLIEDLALANRAY